MESDEKMPLYKTNGIALIMSPCEWQWGLEQNEGKKIISLTTHEIQPIESEHSEVWNQSLIPDF